MQEPEHLEHCLTSQAINRKNAIPNNPGGLALEAIDLRIEPGQLVGVVGPVGSSKTSLLMAIMKEITPVAAAGLSSAAAAFDGACDEVS